MLDSGDASMTDHAHGWTFLSNHAHVMLVLARDSTKRLRDIAGEVGITERAVQRIVAELVEAGALHRERIGRRNHYVLNWDLPLRHRLEQSHTVGEILQTLAADR